MRSLTSSDSSERATRQDSVASTSTSEPNSLDPGTPGTAVPASHSRASTSASALRSVTPNVSGSHPSTIDAANATSSVLDLAIRATKNYKAGDIIPFLKGSLADLTPEQDRDLREMRNGLQSDFSVLMNERRRVFQLFLGPARFCNVSHTFRKHRLE